MECSLLLHPHLCLTEGKVLFLFEQLFVALGTKSIAIDAGKQLYSTSRLQSPSAVKKKKSPGAWCEAELK